MFFSRRRIATFGACLLLTMLPTVGSAQEATDQADRSATALQPGTYALLFEIVGDLNLESFDGAMIALKRQSSTNRAWRLGLTIRGSIANLEETDSESAAGWLDIDSLILRQSLSRSGESDARALSVGATVDRLFYTSVIRQVTFVWGLGPTASFSSGKSSRTISQTYQHGDIDVWETEYRRTETTITGWSAGAQVVAGAEWFVRHNISLLGEYSAVLSYSQSQRTQEFNTTRYESDLAGNIGRYVDEGVTKDDSEEVSFGSSAVRFGVTIYFGG